VGRNYVAHARELGNDVPESPLIFLKPSTSVIHDGDAIVLTPLSSQVEFEGEIGVRIGKVLRNATREEALAAIDGVVAINDVTARDLQRRDGQWTRAKGFDTFCPVGNVATRYGRFEDLSIVTRVNGVERQSGKASDMVFDIATILVYIAAVMTLEPGDLVATGTPEGVGPLHADDVVEVEIPGFSKVTNTVRGAR
jgi:2-keto-4-pentenoate hydratase/2-oxohepta-3-ene-1,7-dioic acid hydratase in catechol pathway